MRKAVTFPEFAERVEARKWELGITDAQFATMRNSGKRRTPEKRELLRRMAKRAWAAGVAPVPSEY